jgi:glycosyltransferase involved in cell wall biosynthesis
VSSADVVAAHAEPASRTLLQGAQLLIADCGATARALRTMLGEAAAVIERPPSVYADPQQARPAVNGSLRAAAAGSLAEDELLALAEAVKLAVERGADLWIRAPHAPAEVAEVLRLRLAELGLDERFALPKTSGAGSAAGLLAGSSVLIATSRSSGAASGSAAREVLAAMAQGVPVIGTRGGPLEEMVAHDQDGLLVAGPTELAAALERLAKEPALAARLGEHARQRFLAQFAPELAAAEVAARIAQLRR